ncbi:MAG: hypothetical protein K2K96_03720 [Lachnospiraceae bacterium]|nr:hypothetical protein [Lachnospiraceae bacterium]
MKWEYLSDEELDQLVKEIEAEPLCQAPEYLKPMILDKAKAYDRSGHKTSAGMQLFAYSVKIMAAAAAAVIVILTVPVMDKAQSLDYMEQSAQAELEQMRDRAADREQAQIQDRTENMNRVNVRRAREEELAGFRESFFTGRWREEPGEEEEGQNSDDSDKERSEDTGIDILDWFHEIIK